MELKIISWNVNGIRAVLKKRFKEFIEEQKPDILCIQETKAQKEEIQVDLDNYNLYTNSANKKGYSGTAVFSKLKPMNVTYGLKNEEHNKEGRVITLEYEKYFLVNVYTPNSQRELARLDYRMKWEEEFKKYLKELEENKPVILCGDLNVAHKEIDIARPESNKTTKTRPGNAGFTDQEREKFTQLLESGFIDTFRYFNPDKKDAYTWWSYMFNARTKNIGWRLDYFCVSEDLKKNLISSEILSNIMGSDHCPIVLRIDI